MRPNTQWHAKAEVVRTLSATAASSNRARTNPSSSTDAGVARKSTATAARSDEAFSSNLPVGTDDDSSTQPDLLSAAPAPLLLVRPRPRPARASVASREISLTATHSAGAIRDDAVTSTPGEHATRPESTVSFRPSDSGCLGDAKVSALKLAALLELCALDDQGVEVEWPDGLDYVSSLELLDSHNAIDLDEVETWKQHDCSGSSPPASAVADPSSSSDNWNARALTDLSELHDDGLPVRWPEGLNITIAKEQLHSLTACGSG